jgi:hypothetical protein
MLKLSYEDIIAERDGALERVVALYEKGGGEDSDELNKALDVLAIAHTAATFEWASNSLSGE